MRALPPLNRALPRRLIPGLVCLLLAVGGPVLAQKARKAQPKAPASAEKQLEQIEKQIKDSDTRAKGLEKQEQGLVRQIHDYERRIDGSRQTLKGLVGEIDEINRELAFINNQLTGLSRKLDDKKAILHRRLRGIYKRGRLHAVAVMLGSHSFTDLAKRLKYLTMIAEQDQRLVREVGQLRQTYAEYRGASRRKLTQRVERRQALETEQRKLERAEGERQKLLRSVKAQKEEVLKVLAQRKEEAEALRRLIAEMERKRKEALEQARREGRTAPEQDFLAGQRGKLQWPVAAGRLVRGFGMYTDEITRTRVINNGIDIQAPAGRPVMAVADGAVRVVDWYRSYGKMVMVDHGGGMYSLYCHLGEIFVKEGEPVTRGQAIASVGSTGSLDGPVLHFEIREGMKAVDPIKWLGKGS